MSNESDLITLVQQGRALELSLNEAINQPQADKTFNFTMIMTAVQKYCALVKKTIPTLNMDQKIILSNIVASILEYTTILEKRIQGVIDSETSKKSNTKATNAKAKKAYGKKRL